MTADKRIEGLFYERDFLSEAEAQAIVNDIDQATWDTTLQRRVQHYGYRYDYKNRSVSGVSEAAAFPEWMLQLRGKVQRHVGADYVFDQVIVNEYLPGQGIAGHVDCIPCFDDKIVSISLISQCVMQFSAPGEQHSLLLEPRSLLMLSGESRYGWKHGIKAVKNDRWMDQVLPRGRRVSVTFRKIR